MNIKHDIDYFDRFQKVVCFLTLTSIKKNFKTLDEYSKAANCRKAIFLHIMDSILRKLSKTPDGRVHFQEFIDKSGHIFKYHRHCHKHYKSGKKFSRNSWFELDAGWLAQNFKEQNFNTATCEFLTKEYHKWIDKKVYGYEHGGRRSKPAAAGKPEAGTGIRQAERGEERQTRIKQVYDQPRKTEHPADDLPAIVYEEPLTIEALQKAVNERKISCGFARIAAEAAGITGKIKDHPRGFNSLDSDAKVFKAGNKELVRKLDRMSTVYVFDEKRLAKIKECA